MKQPDLFPSQISKLETTIIRMGGRLAFTREVRREIGNRAGWKSELSGLSSRDGYNLHAAHLNHDRQREDYNSPTNGLMMTVEEHLRHHESYRGRAHLIGLTEEGNEWAIRKLQQTPRFRI